MKKLFKYLLGFLFDDYMDGNVRISSKGREFLKDRKSASTASKLLSKGEREIIVGKWKIKQI